MAATASRSPASRRAAPARAALERAAGAGVETAVFAKADHADRDARDAALGNWLDEHGVDLRRARRLHGDPRRTVHPPLRRPADQRPSVAAAGLPRRARDRAGARLRRAVSGVTVHFVDEGVDTGPVILQEAFELPYARAVEEVERMHARDRAPAAAARGQADRRRRRCARPVQPAAWYAWSGEAMSRSAPRRPPQPGDVRVRRALLTVSDKRGLVDFARGLKELGIEIVSTGGTALDARRRRHRDALGRGLHRLPGDPRRPRQDAQPAHLCRPARRPLEPRARRRRSSEQRDRADRPRLREPLSVRARRPAGAASTRTR